MRYDFEFAQFSQTSKPKESFSSAVVIGRILALPPERRSPTRQVLSIPRKRAGSEIGAPPLPPSRGQYQDAPGCTTTGFFGVSRGEQSRRSFVVSKAGIFLAAPPLLEEGERSDARRKEGWCGQARRLRFTSLKSINNSSIVTRLPSSAMCSPHSGNTNPVPSNPPLNSVSPPAAFTL